MSHALWFIAFTALVWFSGVCAGMRVVNWKPKSGPRPATVETIAGAGALVALLFALAGCGGSGGDPSPSPPSVPNVAISGGTATASHAGAFNLTVGAGAVVTIAPSQTIVNLTIGGGSDVTLGASSSITGNVTIGGTSTLHVPAGWTASGTLTVGPGSSVLYDSAAALPVGSG